jgi:hypothetical protein
MATASKNQQAAFDAWIAGLVKDHRHAANLDTWDGSGETPYFVSCRRMNPFRGIATLMTRDVGYHTSGWWKNPDFERCYHLTVSYFDPQTQRPMPQNHQVTAKIAKAMFFPHVKWVLVEPPYYETGQRRDVWHYRLFCDERWQPLKPSGEVYSTANTKAGWKSFSEVQAVIEQFGVNPNVSE